MSKFCLKTAFRRCLFREKTMAKDKKICLFCKKTLVIKKKVSICAGCRKRGLEWTIGTFGTVASLVIYSQFKKDKE